MNYFKSFSILFLILISFSSYSQDKLLSILSDELNREMDILKKQENAPYYMNYRINDVHTYRISSSFGTLVNSENKKERILTISLRIGSPELDNTREIRGDNNVFSFDFSQPTLLPIEDSPESLKQIIWKKTNEEYRAAVDKYIKVKANVASKVAQEDKSPDFSIEPTVNYYEPPLSDNEIKFDKSLWEQKVKAYSKLFLDEPEIYNGSSTLSWTVERKYFVASDGSQIAQNMTYCRLFVSGTIKAEDGMVMPLYLSYFSFKPEGLPSDDKILSDVKEMVKTLKALKNAPIAEPYTGPAILTGRASGVFFHEIFGHRIEGHRQKSEYEGQTFKKKIGERILPSTMNIIFDPTIKNYKGNDLVGYYKFDDEGVQAQKVAIVENGVLKNFLMSRCPIENFPKSNGHGRAEASYEPVARQSNLILETNQPRTKDELRKLLIDECKAQGLPYGYYIIDITGGFTITGRTIPNSFNVMPTLVYRIYTDGRADEIVRGVDLVGTPLAMFSQIAEAGNDPEVFTGICGAESGGVPVTAISPTIFVKKIETQKKSKSQEKPPILPRPGTKSDKD